MWCLHHRKLTHVGIINVNQLPLLHPLLTAICKHEWVRWCYEMYYDDSECF